MYAIVEQGGNQHKVHEGDVVQIDSTALEGGSEFKFERVLLYNDEAGDVRVGKPCLEDVTVIGTAKSPVKGVKSIAIRFKRRKGIRTRHGHRQTYQQVLINSITAN